MTGPSGCDDRSALEHEVKRRSERVSFVEAESASASVVVRIDARSDRFEAALFIDRPAEEPVRRVISAGNCEEVLEGAALIIAVVLSPSQHERPAPAPR